MTRYIKIIFTIVCLTFSILTKADSWIDPSWKEMLDSSEVIALVEYTSNVDFRASAKILNTYKGNLKIGEEIWISGFSNRYGPIDKMSKGDRYLVFLNLSEPSEDRMEYWNDELAKNRGLKNYIKALKSKKAFYVWSPTSGDLKVDSKKVQYDLIQTSFYQKQSFYSLSNFEKFLYAYHNIEQKSILCNELLTKIKPVSESDTQVLRPTQNISKENMKWKIP